jgi:hypothetical protein
VKPLLLRSLIAAILIGSAIGFVTEVASIKGGMRYEPLLSEEEVTQMRSISPNQMEGSLASRRIRMNRWEWLKYSIHYSYYWKHVAQNTIVATCGLFLGCVWVGWMEKKQPLERKA